MKLLEKGVYKVFAGLVLVSMIGALVAEPVVLGDVGLYYEYEHLKEGHTTQAILDDGVVHVIGSARTIGYGISRLALVASAGEEAGLLAAGVATGGTALIAIGVFVAA
ncbi:hypothetical protein [Methanocaldococcus sp.]